MQTSSTNREIRHVHVDLMHPPAVNRDDLKDHSGACRRFVEEDVFFLLDPCATSRYLYCLIIPNPSNLSLNTLLVLNTVFLFRVVCHLPYDLHDLAVQLAFGGDFIMKPHG